MFWKNVVLYEIYSKKLQWPNTFGTSLYIQKCIKKEPYLKIDNFQWKEKNSQNITFKCSFKQCRSLKFLNKDNKLILLFSYVQKRSFQMCAHADILNQENYVQ